MNHTELNVNVFANKTVNLNYYTKYILNFTNMIIIQIIGLMAFLLGGIAFAVNGANVDSSMTEYDIYGEKGEDEWTRQAMGMTKEEYKEFMGEEHFNRKR